MGSIEEAQLKEIRSQFPSDWEVPEFRIDFWDGMTSDYCVIVPVINEGERIREFVKRLEENKINSIADIIIVDGGSTDGSLDYRFLRSHGVRGLLTKTDVGRLGAQLRIAYAYALTLGYIGVITIDGNNKDDSSPIVNFILGLSQGFDFIQASRFIPGGLAQNTPLLRYCGIRLVHAPLLSIASGFSWSDTTQGFRAYSSRLLGSPAINIFRSIFNEYELLFYLSAISPRAGFRCTEMPTSRKYPKGIVPTKISSFRGNMKILLVLIKACLRVYDPE